MGERTGVGEQQLDRAGIERIGGSGALERLRAFLGLGEPQLGRQVARIVEGEQRSGHLAVGGGTEELGLSPSRLLRELRRLLKRAFVVLVDPLQQLDEHGGGTIGIRERPMFRTRVEPK